VCATVAHTLDSINRLKDCNRIADRNRHPIARRGAISIA
jgi:hypothetical protein